MQFADRPRQWVWSVFRRWDWRFAWRAAMRRATAAAGGGSTARGLAAVGDGPVEVVLGRRLAEGPSPEDDGFLLTTQELCLFPEKVTIQKVGSFLWLSR